MMSRTETISEGKRAEKKYKGERRLRVMRKDEGRKRDSRGGKYE